MYKEKKGLSRCDMSGDLMIAQGPCDYMLSKKGSLGIIKGKSSNLKREDVFG